MLLSNISETKRMAVRNAQHPAPSHFAIAECPSRRQLGVVGYRLKDCLGSVSVEMVVRTRMPVSATPCGAPPCLRLSAVAATFSEVKPALLCSLRVEESLARCCGSDR